MHSEKYPEKARIPDWVYLVVLAVVAVLLVEFTIGCGVNPQPRPPASSQTPTAVPPMSTAMPPSAGPIIRIQPAFCNQSQSMYIGAVRREMANWRAAHPFLFEGEMLVWCAAGHEADYPCPISQDVYLMGVAKGLEKYRLQGILDGDSGDLIIADANTRVGVGGGYAETFHPLSSWSDLNQSGRLVQGNVGYHGHCEPRWLGYK